MNILSMEGLEGIPSNELITAGLQKNVNKQKLILEISQSIISEIVDLSMDLLPMHLQEIIEQIMYLSTLLK